MNQSELRMESPAHEAQQTASGADLARQALAAYRSAATNKPAGKKPGRRTRTSRTDGRDPVGFGAVLAGLNDAQDWRMSLDGGSILDRWTTICPEVFRDITQPVAFDPDRGRLDIRPGSYPAASQLRLLGGQLATELNNKLGREVVRTIRVLPVGTITPASPSSSRPPEKPTAAGPVRTRDTASPGYQLALQAHLAHKPEPGPTNPRFRAAIEASDRALADPTHREPETAFTEAAAALELATGGQPADSLEASLRAARARAARERVGEAQPVRRLFDTA